MRGARGVAAISSWRLSPAPLSAFTAAHAQDASSQGSQSKKGDGELQEIIVTANKEENLQNIGAGISVVSDARLDQLQANKPCGLFARDPRHQSSTYGAPGWGDIEIRGISPQECRRHGVNLHRQHPGWRILGHQRGWRPYLPDMELADLQRVEVLKGPQGTLYGASSLGGVIKYVTKQPSLTETEGNVSEEFEHVDHGQFQAARCGPRFRPPLTDELAVRVSGYYRWIPGYIDDLGIGGQDANHGYDWGMRLTALWKPTSDLTVNINAMEQQLRQDAYNNVDLNATTFQPFYVRALSAAVFAGDLRVPNQPLPRRRSTTSCSLRHVPLGHELQQHPPDPDGGRDRLFRRFPNGSTSIGPDNPLGYTGHHDDQQETEELRFTSNRIGNFEFLAGGFYQHESLNDGAAFTEYQQGGRVPDTSDPPLGGYERGGTLWEAAGFLNGTYYIVPSLDVTLGYRYSEIGQHRSSWIRGTIYEGSPSAVEFDDLSTTQSSDTYLAWARAGASRTMSWSTCVRASGYRPGGVRSPLPGGPANFSLQYTSDSIWSYEAGHQDQMARWQADGGHRRLLDQLGTTFRPS